MYASQLWNLLTLSYVFAKYLTCLRRLIIPKEYNGPGRVPQNTEYKPPKLRQQSHSSVLTNHYSHSFRDSLVCAGRCGTGFRASEVGSYVL